MPMVNFHEYERWNLMVKLSILVIVMIDLSRYTINFNCDNFFLYFTNMNVEYKWWKKFDWFFVFLPLLVAGSLFLFHVSRVLFVFIILRVLCLLFGIQFCFPTLFQYSCWKFHSSYYFVFYLHQTMSGTCLRLLSNAVTAARRQRYHCRDFKSWESVSYLKPKTVIVFLFCLWDYLRSTQILLNHRRIYNFTHMSFVWHHLRHISTQFKAHWS